MPGPGGRTLGLAAGLAALGGAAYGVQRAIVGTALRKPDPMAVRDLVLRFDESFDVASHDGGTIRVVSRGEGPTIVLSHGVTLANRVWVYQFDSLPELGFRVVAYDHRGHGESRCGDSRHSLANLALDAKTVLEAVDARNAVFVGHSMGGVAVQALALDHGRVVRERLAGMVLLSTIGRVPMAKLPGAGDAFMQVISRGPGIGAFMRQPTLGYTLVRLGFGRKAYARHVELVRRIIAECPNDTSHEATGALLGLDFLSRLPALSVPTLVIGGTADVLAPILESRRLAEAIPDSRLVELAGLGHMIMLEAPEVLDDLIVAFAEQVGAAPKAA